MSKNQAERAKSEYARAVLVVRSHYPLAFGSAMAQISQEAFVGFFTLGGPQYADFDAAAFREACARKDVVEPARPRDFPLACHTPGCYLAVDNKGNCTTHGAPGKAPKTPKRAKTPKGK